MASNTKRVATGGAGLGAVLLLAAPLVAAWEGKSNDPYLDIAKIPTVCRGETAVEMRHYTDDECDVMFQRSLLKHATPILSCLPPDAPVEVKAAFVSFGYNVGVQAACGSSAARQARAHDYARACASLGSWVMAGGKRVQGLVNRRKAETTLCLKGLA